MIYNLSAVHGKLLKLKGNTSSENVEKNICMTAWNLFLFTGYGYPQAKKSIKSIFDRVRDFLDNLLFLLTFTLKGSTPKLKKTKGF